MTVSQPCEAYLRMSQRWDLLHDLLGGTFTMREAGERWLPREPKEKVQAWRNRLARSVLFNAYKNTVNGLSAKPFAVPVTLEDVPEKLETIEYNADRNGTDLTQFARCLFEDAIVYGLAHYLVDMPVNPGGLNLKSEKELDIRPYFVRVKAPNLLGWRIETIAGQDRLVQLRVREYRDIPDGNYDTKQTEFIKVWYPDHWELFRSVDGDMQEVPEEDGGKGENTLGYIPLVTTYFNRTGVLTAMPPLEDLAWLNLAHWQSDSDQRNILRFARVGMISATGITEDEFDKGFVIGANQILKSVNPDAKFGYVEPAGAAIEAGRLDGKDLEARMEVEGLRPMLERTANVKATGQVINEGRTMSNLQAWIRAVETGIEGGMEIAGQWAGIEVNDLNVNIFNDFGVSSRGMEDAATLLKMVQTGKLSHETFLQEMRRRGIISDSIDVAEELERLEQEGPTLPMLEEPDDDLDEEPPE